MLFKTFPFKRLGKSSFEKIENRLDALETDGIFGLFEEEIKTLKQRVSNLELDRVVGSDIPPYIGQGSATNKPEQPPDHIVRVGDVVCINNRNFLFYNDDSPDCSQEYNLHQILRGDAHLKIIKRGSNW